jgi:sulfatase maturation enzyme AslB (radical SAM superfamily)
MRRILLHSPRGITIELTDNCNLRCTYCPKGHGMGIGGASMDFEFFKKVIDEVTEMGVTGVVLVGFGEPLLYPHLTAAIHYIKSRHPSIRTYITTNGVLLEEKISRAIIGSGLDQMTISVNFNSREKYRLHNGADMYDRVVENTKTFLRLLNKEGGSPRPRVFVQILDGLNSPEEMRDFCESWGPRLPSNGVVQVQPLVNWAGLITESGNKVLGSARYPCIHMQRSWIVTREGNALACCMVFPLDQGNEMVLGKMTEKSLEELYSSDHIRELRAKNMDCDYATMPTCRACNAYRTAPNVFVRNPFHRWFGKRWL